jgi:2-isopropylmalate synthase
MTNLSNTSNNQQPSGMPIGRYTAFVPVDVPDRTWPTKKITHAPRWLSTDLRDGNQALIDPMTPARKLKMFELLVQMGYKEIEVGFPSASQTDFDFVRKLVEEDRVPDDVQISVLTQAREDLIERTVQSLVGANRATVHLYNATAPLFQKVVFQVTPEECRQIAVRGTEMVMKYAESLLGDIVGSEDFGYQYSPEIFTQSDTDFAISVCEAVSDVWQPEAGREIILNLPATVEMSTPNTYADQIEYFGRGLTRREHSAISLHPHNDRGTAVAATELALMAGADRVEGCLFGHGERTGNVCLVTLGMNLFSQGIDPMIDFSDIDEVRRTVEYCTNLPVHPRHPYAGDLVYTAFSGSHQDAIKKGLEDLERRASEEGRQVGEMPLKLNSVHTSSAAGEKDRLDVNVYVDGELHSLSGEGNGPIAAFVDAINGVERPAGSFDVRVLDYAEHALSAGGDAIAAAYVECAITGPDGDTEVVWGCGLDANIVTASLKAVISAVNRVG